MGKKGKGNQSDLDQYKPRGKKTKTTTLPTLPEKKSNHTSQEEKAHRFSAGGGKS